MDTFEKNFSVKEVLEKRRVFYLNAEPLKALWHLQDVPQIEGGLNERLVHRIVEWRGLLLVVFGVHLILAIRTGDGKHTHEQEEQQVLHAAAKWTTAFLSRY